MMLRDNKQIARRSVWR